jgi:hypothetical protein
MVNGFSENYNSNVKIFDISKKEITKKSLDSYNILISSGSNANIFLKKYKGKNCQIKIFTFLIYKNECKNFSLDNKTFSIYLYPPAEKLIYFFKKRKINKLIAPYSDKRVGEYLNNSKSLFKLTGIELKIFNITSFTNFEKFLKKYKGYCLWMLPDTLYSSIDIINYLIEKSTMYHIKTIGYNSFFYKIGANYSIIIDYKKMGNLIKNIILHKESNNLINAPFIFKGNNKK